MFKSVKSGVPNENGIILANTIVVLVLATLTVVMPRAFATGPYDDGYNTAKFDFLHHRSYSDSCHTDYGTCNSNRDTLKHGIR